MEFLWEQSLRQGFGYILYLIEVASEKTYKVAGERAKKGAAWSPCVWSINRPHTADPPWDKETGLLHPHVSLSVATPGGNPRKGVFSLRLLWVRQLPSAKDSLQRRSSCGLFRNTCSDWGMRVPAEKGDLLRGQQLPGVKSCWLFYYNCKDHWWANIMHFSKSLLFANQIPNLKLHYKLLSALIIF